MIWLWGLGGIVLTLLLVCILFPISVRIQLFKQEQLDRIRVEIRLLGGLIRIHRELPFFQMNQLFNKFTVDSQMKQKTLVGGQSGTQKKHIKVNEKTVEKQPVHGFFTITLEKIHEWWQTLQNILNMIQEYNKLILKILKMVHIDEWHWKTAIGTGDAAESGMLSGGLWAIKGCVTAALYQYFTVKKKPVFAVYPEFHRKLLQIQFHCIIHIWVGQAIVAGIKLGYIWFREGLPWQNIQSKG